MTAVCENILRAHLVKSENFTNIVLRTGCVLTEYSQDIFQTADKAALLRRFYFGGIDRFAKLQGRVASFVHISQIFSRMRTGKNLTATAQGVSASTPTARKSVSKPIKAIPIYKVSLRAIGAWANDYKSGIYSSDIYQASSPEEAIGMACEYIKAKFPRHSILAEEIKCSLLNPAAL